MLLTVWGALFDQIHHTEDYLSGCHLILHHFDHVHLASVYAGVTVQ